MTAGPDTVLRVRPAPTCVVCGRVTPLAVRDEDDRWVCPAVDTDCAPPLAFVVAGVAVNQAELEAPEPRVPLRAVARALADLYLAGGDLDARTVSEPEHRAVVRALERDVRAARRDAGAQLADLALNPRPAALQRLVDLTRHARALEDRLFDWHATRAGIALRRGRR